MCVVLFDFPKLFCNPVDMHTPNTHIHTQLQIVAEIKIYYLFVRVNYS